MHDRTPFSLESAFKANRPFVLNGVRLNYDDPVDKVGIEPRRLRQMWESRLIEVTIGQVPAKQPEKPAPKAPVRRVVAKAEAAATPAPEAAEAAPEPTEEQGKARLVYAQFGKFDVLNAAGDVVAKGLSKDEAQRRLQEIG